MRVFFIAYQFVQCLALNEPILSSSGRFPTLCLLYVTEQKEFVGEVGGWVGGGSDRGVDVNQLETVYKTIPPE